MKRAAAGTGAALVLAAAFLFAGCGPGSDQPATDDQARTLAADAAQAIAQLEDETKALTDRVAELESTGDRAGERIDTVSDRLWASLTKLKESLNEMKGISEDAAAQANSALAEAQAAARDLAVLDSRLDYHLRQHGGG
jgi:outer membrane murein-binding lipoprotein Lpp